MGGDSQLVPQLFKFLHFPERYAAATKKLCNCLFVGIFSSADLELCTIFTELLIFVHALAAGHSATFRTSVSVCNCELFPANATGDDFFRLILIFDDGGVAGDLEVFLLAYDVPCDHIFVPHGDHGRPVAAGSGLRIEVEPAFSTEFRCQLDFAVTLRTLFIPGQSGSAFHTESGSLFMSGAALSTFDHKNLTASFSKRLTTFTAKRFAGSNCAVAFGAPDTLGGRLCFGKQYVVPVAHAADCLNGGFHAVNKAVIVGGGI